MALGEALYPLLSGVVSYLSFILLFSLSHCLCEKLPHKIVNNLTWKPKSDLVNPGLGRKRHRQGEYQRDEEFLMGILLDICSELLKDEGKVTFMK